MIVFEKLAFNIYSKIYKYTFIIKKILILLFRKMNKIKLTMTKECVFKVQLLELCNS